MYVCACVLRAYLTHTHTRGHTYYGGKIVHVGTPLPLFCHVHISLMTRHSRDRILETWSKHPAALEHAARSHPSLSIRQDRNPETGTRKDDDAPEPDGSPPRELSRAANSRTRERESAHLLCILHTYIHTIISIIIYIYIYIYIYIVYNSIYVCIYIYIYICIYIYIYIYIYTHTTLYHRRRARFARRTIRMSEPDPSVPEA